jgi:hypothetical protein
VKGAARKRTHGGEVWKENGWTVKSGRLVGRKGRPKGGKPLFRFVAEKIPFEALAAAEKYYKRHEGSASGVYLAHDSMGHVRYAGRGNVFERLRARRRAAPLELCYFSFYILESRKHEREVETLLIRIGGAHLHFNDRKKRVDIQPGNVADYEPGTGYLVRQYTKGKKARSVAR